MRSPNLESPVGLRTVLRAAVQLATLIVIAAGSGSFFLATTSTHSLQRVAAATAPRVSPDEAATTTRAVDHERVAALPATPLATDRIAAVRHASRGELRLADSPWLPSGTGIWIYQWNRTNGGNARAVVARAGQADLSTLYVRTGSSSDGFRGAGVLRALLPATRGTSLHVVAWDFPDLRQPMADAARLARAAWFLRTSPTHVAAVAPDIETPAEGTHLTGSRVAAYLRALRARLPHDVAILTTVPWPSPSRVGNYPYATVAAWSDAVLPMTYWYNDSPETVTATSIQILRRFHRPVLPVGQGFDGRLDTPWLRPNDLARQVPAFLATAHRLGVPAVSLWSWEAAPPVVWNVLSWARHWFPVTGTL